jgi:tetratricopeptide (TPR) repeat protein
VTHVSTFDVFLSHNSADKPQVRLIRELLTARGLKCWFDEVDISSSATHIPQLEAGLSASKCCVLFYGPSGIGPWHELERQLAQLMAAEAWRNGQHFGIIPVRLPEAPEWRKLALPPFLRLYASVDLPTIGEGEALERLINAISQEAAPPETEPADSNESPYPGMTPYLEKDASKYFGRANYILHICALLQGATATRFVAILGASGSGKSSLMHAGVLPHLRAGRSHRETKDWIYIKVRTGGNAWGNLRAAVLGTAPFDRLPNFSASAEGQWLHEIATAALSNEGGARRVVLLIDQLEELLTSRPNPNGNTPSEQQPFEKYRRETWVPFVTNIAYAVSQPGGFVSVVATVRSDFVAPLIGDPSIGPLLDDINLRCLVLPLLENEVRATIERPAIAARLQLDRALVERLVQDYLLDSTGALPFLQEALHRIWAQREQTQLSLAAYRGFGGLSGAVNAHAEDSIKHLEKDDPKNGPLFRQVFVHLVRLGDDGGPDTKRRRPLAELPGGQDAQKLAETLSGAEYRLLVLDENSEEGNHDNGRQVEIAHESLISGWKRLDDWLKDKDARPLRLRLRRYEATARLWRAQDPNAQQVSPLTGNELKGAEMVFERLREEVPGVLAEYIRESRKTANQGLIKQGVAITALVALLATLFILLERPFETHSDPTLQDRAELSTLVDPKTNDIVSNHSKALLLARKILKVWKGDSEIRFRETSALMALHHEAELREAITQWNANVPEPRPYFDLLLAEEASQKGHPLEAIALWKKTLERPSATSLEKKMARPKLAAAYAKNNSWAEAQALYKSWLAEDDNATARAGLTTVYRASGQWDQYDAAFRDLKSRFPGSQQALEIASLPPVDELRRLEHIATSDPYNEKNWIDYVTALAKAHQFKLALETCEAMLDRGLSSFPVNIWTVHLHWLQGESIPQSLEVVPSPQWKPPDSAGFLTSLETMVSNLKIYAEASKTIETQPTAEACYTRGEALRRLGQDRLALVDYDAAVRLNPGSEKFRMARDSAQSRLQTSPNQTETDPKHHP